jgi:hypothetical protein
MGFFVHDELFGPVRSPFEFLFEVSLGFIAGGILGFLVLL